MMERHVDNARKAKERTGSELSACVITPGLNSATAGDRDIVSGSDGEAGEIGIQAGNAGIGGGEHFEWE
jgi:hypothetical protein